MGMNSINYSIQIPIIVRAIKQLTTDVSYTVSNVICKYICDL